MCAHCRQSQGLCQGKKSQTLFGTPLKPGAVLSFRFVALGRNSVQKWPCERPIKASSFHSIFTLCGLSEGLGPLHQGFDPRSMHKILLAEDDNDMRRFLVKALENAGFQVSSHDNGMSAYQRLREEPFEMLLTDIVMPEMDGIELARRASELDPDIKIMFITGFAAVALNSDSEAPKNAKVLSKPVHLRELVSEVNKMLAA